MRWAGVILRVSGVVGREVNKKQIRAIEIRAEVRQIKTMSDGSINVILNLPEDCKDQAKVLIDWQGLEVRAVVAKK